jgi:hypothetical protein
VVRRRARSRIARLDHLNSKLNEIGKLSDEGVAVLVASAPLRASPFVPL